MNLNIKKSISAFLCISALLGCSQPQASATPTPEVTPTSELTEAPSSEATSSKVLIAYFSRADENYNVGIIEEGNTYKVAKEIQAVTGGDLFEIQTTYSYPASYDECIEVAKQEQADKARPELKQQVENFEQYDEIYLGYPIWWGDMPMVVYTFLETYDFSGKTIHPFNTHEGSGVSGTNQTIANLVPNATVTESLAIRGSVAQNEPETVKQEVANWIK